MPEFKSNEKRSGNSQPLRWAIKRDSASAHGNKTYPASILVSGTDTDPTEICVKNDFHGVDESDQLAAECANPGLSPAPDPKGLERYESGKSSSAKTTIKKKIINTLNN